MASQEIQDSQDVEVVRSPAPKGSRDIDAVSLGSWIMESQERDLVDPAEVPTEVIPPPQMTAPVPTSDVIQVLEGDSLQPDDAVSPTSVSKLLISPIEIMSAQLRVQMAILKEVRMVKAELQKSRSRSPHGHGCRE